MAHGIEQQGSLKLKYISKYKIFSIEIDWEINLPTVRRLYLFSKPLPNVG